MSRTQESKLATTRGPNDFAATRRTWLCRGGSMCSSTSAAGLPGARLVCGHEHPWVDVKVCGSRSIAAMSSIRVTAQNPPLRVPTVVGCQYRPGLRRIASKASCGTSVAKVAGSVRSGMVGARCCSIVIDIGEISVPVGRRQTAATSNPGCRIRVFGHEAKGCGAAIGMTARSDGSGRDDDDQGPSLIHTLLVSV